MSQYESEIKRRRTFAIISHPDAGKTTLTEKFLLYGGAIAQAGQVKGKKNTRAATSDWMEIEKQRGISVTSSVLQFNYAGKCVNILDTPGHQDFSEDTYRTLMAADSAVMVIDAAKGVEAQTRKLFRVCAMRDIPIFTFINKMDREARDPFELCEELAPLHNPPADACIDMMAALMPNTPQVAVFDTAFHATMPPKAYMYPLPREYYEKYRIRRYGAHGTSHRYAAQQAANLLGRPLRDLGLITCHLGNGGSITAVNHGKSIDTSMGFTPLEGLMMGTRSGSIDPAIVTYLMRREHKSFDEMDAILNKESGILGVSGVSADMRDVLAAAAAGNELADLAIDMYVYRIQKAIGGYYAAMTRTDAVVMTAGIGENSAELRERIFAGLAHMGMILDHERNDVTGQIGVNRIISIDDSPIKICVVTTDEEVRIARETDNLVGQLNE